MYGILHVVPRTGDQTFAELAARAEMTDLSDQSDAELLERANEWIAIRLAVPVEAGVLLAELMRRKWTYIELERETDLNRRSILRWTEPFRTKSKDNTHE